MSCQALCCLRQQDKPTPKKNFGSREDGWLEDTQQEAACMSLWSVPYPCAPLPSAPSQALQLGKPLCSTLPGAGMEQLSPLIEETFLQSSGFQSYNSGRARQSLLKLPGCWKHWCFILGLCLCTWLMLCCCRQISECLGWMRGRPCCEDYSPCRVIPLWSCVTLLFEQCPTVVPWEATTCQKRTSWGCFSLCLVETSSCCGTGIAGSEHPSMCSSRSTTILQQPGRRLGSFSGIAGS